MSISMVEATVSYAGAGDQRPAPDANMTRCQLFGESSFRRDCICSIHGMYSARKLGLVMCWASVQWGLSWMRCCTAAAGLHVCKSAHVDTGST
jgi:hypothetical protein